MATFKVVRGASWNLAFTYKVGDVNDDLTGCAFELITKAPAIGPFTVANGALTVNLPTATVTLHVTDEATALWPIGVTTFRLWREYPSGDRIPSKLQRLRVVAP